MTISNRVIDKIRDSKNIGRSIITFANGILCTALVVISGTSSVDSDKDAIRLRNLSVGFGAAVGVLNLILELTINIMISVYTDNSKDEQTLKELVTYDPVINPDESIIEATQTMVSILNKMKIANNNLDENSVNKPVDFGNQLKNLEDALNKFGTIP